MNKSISSRLVVAVVLAIAVVLAGAYFVINGRSSGDQEQSNNADNTSQIDVDKPLDTAADSIANDIEKELNALAEDDYSDSSLSDTALYE